MNELLAIIFIVFYPFYFTCTRKPKNTKENIIDSLLQENLDSFRYQNNNNTSINTTETIGNNVNNTDNNKGNLTDLNEKIMKLILKDY